MNLARDEATSIKDRWVAQQQAIIDAQERAFWRGLRQALAWAALIAFGAVAALALACKLLDLFA